MNKPFTKEELERNKNIYAVQEDVLTLGNKFVEIDISDKDKKTFNQGLDYLDEILEDLTQENADHAKSNCMVKTQVGMED